VSKMPRWYLAVWSAISRCDSLHFPFGRRRSLQAPPTLALVVPILIGREEMPREVFIHEAIAASGPSSHPCVSQPHEHYHPVLADAVEV
jgi:hypothetical protein